MLTGHITHFLTKSIEFTDTQSEYKMGFQGSVTVSLDITDFNIEGIFELLMCEVEVVTVCSRRTSVFCLRRDSIFHPHHISE